MEELVGAEGLVYFLEAWGWGGGRSPAVNSRS